MRLTILVDVLDRIHLSLKVILKLAVCDCVYQFTMTLACVVYLAYFQKTHNELDEKDKNIEVCDINRKDSRSVSIDDLGSLL